MEAIVLNKEFSDKLSELGVLNQYLANMTISKQEANNEFLENGFKDALSGAFIYSKTPEGFDFWKEIENKLTD